MGYFETSGLIPENSSLIENLIVLSLLRPRLIYALQLGAKQHQIGTHTFEVEIALNNALSEINELMTRISAKQFKNYQKKRHDQEGLDVIGHDFWRKFSVLRRYIKDLNQPEEGLIKQAISRREREAQTLGRNFENREIKIYIDFENQVQRVIRSLNKGKIPTAYGENPLDFVDLIYQYTEQVITTNPSLALWMEIADQCFQANELIHGLNACEEAWWLAGSEEERHRVIVYLQDKLQKVNSTSPLLDYYIEILKYWKNVQLDEGEYRKLYQMWSALQPGSYIVDPSIKRPPLFRLKSTLILSVLFFEIFKDEIELVRKLEELQHHIVNWGSKDTDVAELTRQAVATFYAKQEHEIGITQSIKNTKQLYDAISNQTHSMAANLVLDQVSAFLYFNRIEIAKEIFEKLPVADVEKLKAITFTDHQKYSLEANYVAKYSFFKLLVHGDTLPLKLLIEELGRIAGLQFTDVTDRQDASRNVQFLNVFLKLVKLLISNANKINLQLYFEQLWQVFDKAPFPLQVLCLITPSTNPEILGVLLKAPSVKDEYYRRCVELLTNHLPAILELCTREGRYTRLSLLIKSIIIFSEYELPRQQLLEVIIEHTQKPLFPTDLIDIIPLDNLLSLFRDINNYEVILNELIAVSRNSQRNLTSYWLELILVRLLVEKKLPTARERFLALGDTLWSLATPNLEAWRPKWRFLNSYVEICPFFGFDGMRFLEMQYNSWVNSATLETSESGQNTRISAPSHFISEVGNSLAKTACKIDENLTVAIEIIRRMLGVYELRSQEPSDQAPFVLFDGLAANMKFISKLPLPPEQRHTICSRIGQMAITFLESDFIKQETNARHVLFPVQTLSQCSLGLASIGDMETARHYWNYAFDKIKISSGIEWSARSFAYRTFAEALIDSLRDDISSFKDQIMEDLVKDLVVALKPSQRKTSLYLDNNFFAVAELMMQLLQDTNSAAIAKILELRGKEEREVTAEIYRIWREAGVLY